MTPPTLAVANGAPRVATAGFGIDRIRQLLPHRWPMLLVDRVDSVGPGARICGTKSVAGTEPWFGGHFPNQSVLPGVIAIEALAQLAGILAALLDAPEPTGTANGNGHPLGDPVAQRTAPVAVYFTGIRSARFRRPIVPGDQIVMLVERTAGVGGFGEYRASARVGDQIAVEATLTLADPASLASRGPVPAYSLTQERKQ